MADYQKPQVHFTNLGQNWHRPVDDIEEDKWCYLKNVRSYEDGTMTSRPGLTQFVALGLGPGQSYTVIARLNNNYPAIYTNFQFVYVLGMTGGQLFVGQTAAVLTNATFNPPNTGIFTPRNPTPGTGQLAFSGNPMCAVDASPVGTDLAFKYIGDLFQNCSVGYYPGDDSFNQMARCISMGMLPPVNQAVPAAGGAGNLNGAYQWRFVYRRTVTGAQSNPSAATRVSTATPTLTLTNQSATFTVPTTPTDPQTNAPDTHVVVDIYRFGGTVFRWKLVGSTTSGASFTDNTADSAILSAQEPSQTVNPISGISHFNLFQPFVVQDIQHTGTGTLAFTGGKWILTATGISINTINLGWLPGSTIVINGVNFTIYQVISPSIVELTEDASRVGAGSFSWSVPAGTLFMGAPLVHLWGPWGTGQTGSYIFGCGTKFAPGALFWCNGNDPDSTDTYNSLQVTDPSEPLMNGCVYGGNAYCWSTERMFQIYPSLSVAGQFTVQEVPGGRGIWQEFSLGVQSSAFSADISVAWRGKDGIYEFSTNGGIRSLTDEDMYPLFPHDNQPGVPLATLFPFLPNNIEPVTAPQDTGTASLFQKLTWFDGYLFYDYRGQISGNFAFATLVWNNRVQGWVSTDLYPFNGGFVGQSGLPICRGPEISQSPSYFNNPGNNLKIGIGNVIYDYTGPDDAGTPIPCRVVERANDYGDARTQKQLGDLMLDVNPGGITVTPTLRTNYHNTVTALATSNAAARTQLIESIGTGSGLYSITAGLDITWSATSTAGPVTLYQYELAYLVKPELSASRFTDWDDDNYEGAKFVQGMVIQANTFGSTANLTVQGDCATIGPTVPINTGSCEQEIAVSFPTPFIAHMMRVSSDIPISMMSPFKIRWIWEPAPELARYWITQGTSFGVRGYLSHRDVLMAIQSTDVVTLSITPDNQSPVTFTFASTGGILLKPYLSIPPLKCRIGQYAATSPTGFRLYVKDTELRIKEWGSTGPWQIVRPFGDLSFQNGAPGGARI